MFQSTHLREVRHLAVRQLQQDLKVSIHAPTRGATSIRPLTFVVFVKFQSTHLREVRLRIGGEQGSLDWFQSTHLREVRPSSEAIKTFSARFNPRTYERCDEVSAVGLLYPFVSIHAPTRGATNDNVKPVKETRVSIHAPTRGATLLNFFSFCLLSFQSTHLREVRLPEISGTQTLISEFQSTHLREVRR